MQVQELIAQLEQLPPEAEVVAEVEVDSGFYDVPPRHAIGDVWYVEWFSFLDPNKITIKARKIYK